MARLPSLPTIASVSVSIVLKEAVPLSAAPATPAVAISMSMVSSLSARTVISRTELSEAPRASARVAFLMSLTAKVPLAEKAAPENAPANVSIRASLRARTEMGPRENRSADCALASLRLSISTIETDPAAATNPPDPPPTKLSTISRVLDSTCTESA